MAAVLTKRAVGKFAKEGPDGFRWDAEVRGLAARRQSGTTTWVVRYQVAGKPRQITLGRWPDIDVDSARTLAKRRIGEVAHDRDPLAELRSISVAKLLDHFETHHRTRVHGDKPRDDRNTAARLDLLRERWGTRKAGAIRYTDVAELLATVRGPYAQNRLRALVRSVWNRGRAWGLIPATVANPAEGTIANPERARSVRALTPAQQGAVLVAAYDYQVKVSLSAGAAIALIVFTGCRPSEALTLRRIDVDLEAGTLRFANRKAGDELVVPSPEATFLLKHVLAQHESPWCFPSKSGRPLVDLRKPWASVLAAAKLPAGTRVRDLRAAVASNIAATAGLRAAQQVLGHADSRTTLNYTRPGDDERREGLRAHIAAIGEALAKRKG